MPERIEIPAQHNHHRGQNQCLAAPHALFTHDAPMLPPRALSLPPHSHDAPQIIALLDLCAEHDMHTPTPLHIGLTPNAGAADTSPLCLLIEAQDVRHTAAWIDRLHAHHMSAALIMDDPDMLSGDDLRALPGLGLWPVFTAGTTPLITRSPAEIARLIERLPFPSRTLMPRANALQIASDAMMLDVLDRHGIQRVIVPELQLTSTEHPRVHITRHRVVDPGSDTPAHLLAWLRGDRLERARSGALTLGRALIGGAHDLRRRAARKSRR